MDYWIMLLVIFTFARGRYVTGAVVLYGTYGRNRMESQDAVFLYGSTTGIW